MKDISLNPIKIGIAPSDLANDLNPDYKIPGEIGLLFKELEKRQMGAELELEHDYGVFDTDSAARPVFLGIHQPTHEIDVIEEAERIKSIERIKKSMDLAQSVKADYYTVHLQTVDRWKVTSDERRHQIAISLDALREIMAYHSENNHTYPVYVENLEYPKYPATREEIEQLALLLPEISSSPMGITLDAGHLWRSRNLLAENGVGHPDWHIPFAEYFASTIGREAIGNSIGVFHLTGCEDIKTHLLPRIDHEEPSDRSIQPWEYYFRNVGRLAVDFIRDRDNKPVIVNEAFGLTYAEVMDNCEAIREF